MEEALIAYKNVEIHQQELCVLSGVNFDFRAGELVYLIGRVGSGKTSLLKTFYGELAVSSGQARVLDYDMMRIRRKRLPELRRKLGVVYHNLEFVLRATGWKDKAKMKERIEQVLALVGMDHKGYKFPLELSGGEQQRIAIARAVLNSPRIILADEPTGNLDVETGHIILGLLNDLAQKGTLVVVTTHNLQLLQDFPGRVYRCEAHRLMEVDEHVTTAFECKNN